MNELRDIPQNSYGILAQNSGACALDLAVEQVRALGYGVLDGGYSAAALQGIGQEFDDTRARYLASYGEARLRAVDEHNTVRAPLTHGGRAFLELALNTRLRAALTQLIPGKFVLNQQNGIVNPPRETYNQAAWHRDLPYQHFVASRPLAINALFCLDEFTRDNGASFVLPASHKCEAFPSDDYIRASAVQVEAPAGFYLLLDCMRVPRRWFQSYRAPAARRQPHLQHSVFQAADKHPAQHAGAGAQHRGARNPGLRLPGTRLGRRLPRATTEQGRLMHTLVWRRLCASRPVSARP